MGNLFQTKSIIGLHFDCSTPKDLDEGGDGQVLDVFLETLFHCFVGTFSKFLVIDFSQFYPPVIMAPTFGLSVD